MNKTIQKHKKMIKKNIIPLMLNDDITSKELYLDLKT